MNRSFRCTAVVTLALGLNACASMNLKEPKPLLCAVFGSAVGAAAGAWANGAETAAGVGIAGAVAGYFACHAPKSEVTLEPKRPDQKP